MCSIFFPARYSVPVGRESPRHTGKLLGRSFGTRYYLCTSLCGADGSIIVIVILAMPGTIVRTGDAGLEWFFFFFPFFSLWLLGNKRTAIFYTDTRTVTYLLDSLWFRIRTMRNHGSLYGFGLRTGDARASDLCSIRIKMDGVPFFLSFFFFNFT